MVVAMNSHHRCDPTVQEGLVKKLLLAVLVALIGLGPAVGLAQAQAEEKILVGKVQSVDESRTEITLTDGTKLLTPPGSMVRPGALTEGMVVVAVYREEENGNKILSRLSRGESEPAPATPIESPKRF
jgi:hypothetical protein